MRRPGRELMQDSEAPAGLYTEINPQFKHRHAHALRPADARHALRQRWSSSSCLSIVPKVLRPSSSFAMKDVRAGTW